MQEIAGKVSNAGAEHLPPAKRMRLLPGLPRMKWSAADLIVGLRAAIALGFDERRLFVALPFCTIAGLISYRNLPYDPHPLALILVVVCLCAALVWSWRNIDALRFTVAALGFWVGFSLLALHGALFGTPMLIYPTYGTYEAQIVQVLREDATGWRVIVSDIVPQEDARTLPIKRARLFIRDAPPLAAGDVIRGSFRFAPVPGPIVPGGFDSQFHAYFNGVGAFGNTTRAPEIVRTEGAGLRGVIDGVRRGIGLRIDAALPQPAAGIARALTIGDQSRISDETRDTMAAAGLAHVLAISGLHLTLVAGGVFAAIRMGLALSYAFGQRFAVKKIAALGGIVAALVYLSLSGASVSAVRATIMLMLVFGAVLAGRRALTMRNVAIAAIFVIVSDPASVFRPSFQLSFSAVTALVGVYEMMRRNKERQEGIVAGFGRFFGGMAVTSLIAGLATALFAAYHFQQTAPLGVLGNLVALPLVGFVVLPSAFIAVLAMPFGVEGVFLGTMGWATDRILQIAGHVAAWSSGINASPLLLPIALVFGFAALAWFAFLPNRYRFIGPLAIVPLIAIFGLDRPPDVLIAATTQAVAVRAEHDLALIAGRTGSFATDAWSETYQVSIAPSFEDGRCDKAGCIAHSPAGFTLALVKRRDAFDEDCAIADLIVARIAAPQNCRAVTQVIDVQDLRAGGVHWLHWDAGRATFEIRPAITDNNRHWRAQR